MATKTTSTNHPKNVALQYIRTIYLSLGAVIGLVCFVMGASGAIKLGLNVWFPVDNTYNYYSPYQPTPCSQPTINVDSNGKSVSTPHSAAEIADCEMKTKESQDKQAKSEFNRQVSESVALTIVGLPVWLFHFWLIQLDWKKRRED